MNVPADFGENVYLLSSTELGILRFKHGPCRWEIVEADDLSAADVRKLVEIPGFCPQAQVMVVLVSCSLPPEDQEWVKRYFTADGGFLAESSASTSPWYQGFPFMRWVDQFLMKPDALMEPLPLPSSFLRGESCAVFLSSYPSFGCLSYPTFCQFMGDEPSWTARPRRPDFDEHVAYFLRSVAAICDPWSWPVLAGFMSSRNQC
eukprot:6184653-Pleurochrysis_carterae.AAC.1